MRALKQEVARLSISISVIAPGITTTPLLTANNKRLSASPEDYSRDMAANGVPINTPESIALAVCWLLNEQKKANGAGLLIQGNKFADIERGLAKSREQWMGKEMLALFRGGRAAPMFGRLGAEPKAKI